MIAANLSPYPYNVPSQQGAALVLRIALATR